MKTRKRPLLLLSLSLALATLVPSGCDSKTRHDADAPAATGPAAGPATRTVEPQTLTGAVANDAAGSPSEAPPKAGKDKAETAAAVKVMAAVLGRTLDLQSGLLDVLEEHGGKPEALSAAIAAFLKDKSGPIAKAQQELETLREAMTAKPALGPAIMEIQRERVQGLAKRTAAIAKEHPTLMESAEVIAAMKAMAPKAAVEQPAANDRQGDGDDHGHGHTHGHGPRVALPNNQQDAEGDEIVALTEDELKSLGGMLAHETQLITLMEAASGDAEKAAAAMRSYLEANKDDIKRLALLSVKLRSNPDAARQYTLAHKDQVMAAHQRMRKIIEAHPDMMKDSAVLDALATLRRP